MEGIESEAPPALVSGGLVSNRMLEEDPPRYTRASDPREPRVTGSHAESSLSVYQKEFLAEFVDIFVLVFEILIDKTL